MLKPKNVAALAALIDEEKEDSYKNGIAEGIRRAERIFIWWGKQPYAHYTASKGVTDSMVRITARRVTIQITIRRQDVCSDKYVLSARCLCKNLVANPFLTKETRCNSQ